MCGACLGYNRKAFVGRLAKGACIHSQFFDFLDPKSPLGDPNRSAEGSILMDAPLFGSTQRTNPAVGLHIHMLVCTMCPPHVVVVAIQLETRLNLIKDSSYLRRFRHDAVSSVSMHPGCMGTTNPLPGVGCV